MRLWHHALIPYLPRKQLLSQWREVCCIAKNIQVKGSPNHVLVNMIMDYPDSHFNYYAEIVAKEMLARGYKCDFDLFSRYRQTPEVVCTKDDELFYHWHTKTYAKICMSNLYEKYLCGGLNAIEWMALLNGYKEVYREEFSI